MQRLHKCMANLKGGGGGGGRVKLDFGCGDTFQNKQP